MSVTPGGIVQALARAARRCAATDDALVEGIRHSPAAAADETGWAVRRDQVSAVPTSSATGSPSAGSSTPRGWDQAEQILGEDFAGVIERDGWAAYRRFAEATHRTCCAHLLRRCHDMTADAADGHTRVPATARQIPKDALALRDARDAGRVDPQTPAAQVPQLGDRLDLLLAADATCCEPCSQTRQAPACRARRAAHFLVVPGVQATNWRAEQGIRPIVVNRRHWGGDRTRQGADTLQVLASVLRSARQQHRDPVGILAPLLTSPVPIVADLAIPGRPDVPGHDDPAQPRAA
ncbi:MAG: IS66 family transposase [Egibacteraceae bacterium]